jgi:hypothetical protein
MSSPNRHDSLTISVDFFCLAVSMLGLAIITPAVLFAQNPGHFLPATTYPHGYSLEQMIPKVALFESGLDPSLLHRDTPFRILHVSGNPPNKFATYAGKMFYVPLFTVDDSPLILATFPNDRGDAADYFLNVEQLGARSWTITADGHATPVGADFFAGPASTPPLLGGGGTGMLNPWRFSNTTNAWRAHNKIPWRARRRNHDASLW